MERIFIYQEPGLFCHHTYDPAVEEGSLNIHAHEIPEIYYALSDAHYLIEGTHYTLSKGDILLIRPAEAHKLLVDPGKSYEHLLMYFSPDLLKGIDPELRLLDPFYKRSLGEHNHYPAERFPHLSSILSAFSLTPGFERFSILSAVIRVMTEISAMYPEILGEALPPKGFPTHLVEYVNEHLFEELSLPMLGAHFSLSVSQLGRIFREATGTSLWKYVMIKRLLAARAMMQRGEPAQKTAYACGFSDYSSFYRAYMKRFGNAPSADYS